MLAGRRPIDSLRTPAETVEEAASSGAEAPAPYCAWLIANRANARSTATTRRPVELSVTICPVRAANVVPRRRSFSYSSFSAYEHSNITGLYSPCDECRSRIPRWGPSGGLHTRKVSGDPLQAPGHDERPSVGPACGDARACSGRGLAFQRRVAGGGISTSTSGITGVAPRWVKLERRGNVISAFWSDDGATWHFVASDAFTMAGDVHVGLAVSSHDNARLATATFDNVVVR